MMRNEYQTNVPSRGHSSLLRASSGRSLFTSLTLLCCLALSSGLTLTACDRGGDPDPVDAADIIAADVPDGGMSDTAGDVLGRPRVDTCTREGMGSTLGNACEGAEECDDGCYCNGTETCEGSVCASGTDPCVDDVECTESACLEETDQCFQQPRHEMCSNGDACDGAELCDIRRGCSPASPLFCNDDNSCTIDTCDMEEGCDFEVRDLDGDGYVAGTCGGDDCDDDPRFGRMIFPGATEDCHNRRDDNCDGLRDFSDATCLPTNGTCATAEVLPGEGTYSASTRGLSGDYRLSCGSSSGPDNVYRFTLAEMSDVRVSVAGGGSNAQVALRPFASCEAGPDEKCNTGSPPTMLRRSLPAGEWAIIVKTSTGAPFDLLLRITDPTPIPPVDLCNAGTVDISAGGTFSGMYEEVEDDYTLSCHSGSYKDAAYRFTITEAKDVTINASTTGGGFSTTYVSLLTNCSDAGSTVSCTTGNPSTLRRRGLAPGTYFVLLETSNTGAVGWSMDVTITDPVPRTPGDACSTAVDITSAPGSVDLSTVENDGGTSCGGSSSFYRDAVFKFTNPGLRDVALTTQTGFSTHWVSLATMCGSIGSELRCRSGSGSQNNLWRSLPAGEYWVTVATSVSSGMATASVSFSTPTPVPPNDRCSGAIELNRAGGYVSTDTIIDFEDDVSGCGFGSSPDAFYELTITSRSAVTITASSTGGSTSFARLTLRDSCTSTTNLACQTGRPAALSTTLEPGNYILIVEPSSGSRGFDYEMRAFITPL